MTRPLAHPNVAEGCGLDTMAQLRRHLSIAAGSAAELEYHFLLARDLGYVPAQMYGEMLKKLTEVRHLLSGLMEWSRR